MMQLDLGQTGNRSQNKIFDAGLRGGRDGDRVAVAAQSRRDPKNVHLRHGRRTYLCFKALKS